MPLTLLLPSLARGEPEDEVPRRLVAKALARAGLDGPARASLERLTEARLVPELRVEGALAVDAVAGQPRGYAAMLRLAWPFDDAGARESSPASRAIGVERRRVERRGEVTARVGALWRSRVQLARRATPADPIARLTERLRAEELDAELAALTGTVAPRALPSPFEPSTTAAAARPLEGADDDVRDDADDVRDDADDEDADREARDATSRGEPDGADDMTLLDGAP